jgi:hypothetical protein
MSSALATGETIVRNVPLTAMPNSNAVRIAKLTQTVALCDLFLDMIFPPAWGRLSAPFTHTISFPAAFSTEFNITLGPPVSLHM